MFQPSLLHVVFPLFLSSRYGSFLNAFSLVPFFSLLCCLDIEANQLRRGHFKVMVSQAGLGEVDGRRYPGLEQHYSREGDVYIYVARVDVGIELCCYYGIAPTQLVPNSLKMWVRFTIMCVCQGWTYSFSLFRCFYRLGARANFSNHFQA